MYDAKPSDLAATLDDMQFRALERCRYDRVAAQERMQQWIRQDRRMDSYNPEALATRIAACKSNGSTLNLDAPELKKGGQSANGWKQPPGRA